MNAVFTLEKANAKGTGSALKLILYPSWRGGHGYIHTSIAHQIQKGFHWKDCFEYDLTFDILCKMLQVFRGELEDFTESDKSEVLETRISLKHILDDGYLHSGYRFTISKKLYGEEDFSHRSFFISASESLGICLAIEQSMGLIVFGEAKYE